MSLSVINLTTISVETDTLLSAVKQIYQRSPTLNLDKQGIDPRTLRGYVYLLNELKYGINKEISSNVLKHCFHSFMVITLFDIGGTIAQETNLRVLSCKRDDVTLTIISGDLLEWKTALVDMLNENTSTSVRMVLTKCLQEFEKLGLAVLWENSTKVRQADGTMILR